MTLFLGLFVAAQATTGDCNPGDKKKDVVNGIVIHADSRKPLKDVSVTAISHSKKKKVVATNNEGSFAFELLEPGKYTFVFEKDGYKKVTKEQVVKGDDKFQLNIEMIENMEFEIIPSPFGVYGY